MAELHELTAVEQGDAVRRGEISSAELVEHYLARIEAHADLGAFVTVTAEQARTAATRPIGDGPLSGVPIAIKDLTLTAGTRTTFGSAAFADFVPTVDADVVVFLREAGLISLGKTTTSEFGISLYSETEVAAPARNPWRPECTAGGSSGGAAAAVAAGLVPFAQGNDGGGSVRIPAAICGLVGVKPSRGLVSGGPLGAGGFGLPTHGPIARTVTDAAALLEGPGRPGSGGALRPTRTRVAWSVPRRRPPSGRAPAEPAVADRALPRPDAGRRGPAPRHRGGVVGRLRRARGAGL